MAVTAPAKAPPKGAIKPADKTRADDRDDGGASDPSNFFKLVVYGLILLNLAAAGLYLYLRFGRNADLEKSIRTGVRQLSTLKTDLVNLDATAQRISREKVQTVKDPGHPIGLLAANYQIADDVRIEKPVENRIAKSNYVETTVKFTFMKRSSYALFGTPGTNERGLLDFFNDIEKANPAIQIKEIDFGPRQPEDKSGKWEVRSATVRVLKPLKAGK